MLNTKLRRTSLVALAVVLMLSVFVMTAFAEETDGLLISPNPNANDVLAAEDVVDDAADLEVGSDVANAEDAVADTEEAVADAEDAVADTEEAVADAEDAVADEEDAVADEEDKATEEEDSAETADTTATGTTDDGHDHDHDHEEEAKEDGFTTSDLVLLIIFAVVVVIVAIVCIVKREKVGKYFRGIKSEFKKIVWSPWNQVRKNSIVVIVVVIALAVVIGLLDFLFGQGITELKNLINP